MQLKQLVEAIDTQVVSGDIIGAFDRFAADQCVTHSNPQDITTHKAQKMEALRWFFSNVANINRIENLGYTVVGNNETHTQYVFDFTNHQGQSMVFSEVIRRVWADGKLIEEQYLIGHTLPTQKATKSKKAEAAADVKPVTSATEKKATVKKEVAKKESAPKATAKKETAPKQAVTVKADDLTLIEGIGPKIAEILVSNGIVTFADLAKTKPAAIKTILDAAGKRYQMHDPATWPKQATLARDGKTAELAKLQAELKGGK